MWPAIFPLVRIAGGRSLRLRECHRFASHGPREFLPNPRLALLAGLVTFREFIQLEPVAYAPWAAR